MGTEKPLAAVRQTLKPVYNHLQDLIGGCGMAGPIFIK